ncbi:MAG: hypothetical protein HQL36_10550, partial [Alphaproteobacteria bacterium]|nr:hypothetical protein [Alphaproteobacteria bacterium]
AQSLPADSPALVLWVEMYWPRAGDRMDMSVTGPDGEILFSQTKTIEKSQARRFDFTGKRLTGSAWPSGAYRGVVTVTAPNGPARTLDAHIVLNP